MNKTTVGLPNTCCQCAAPQREFWYAAHDDAARSGQGYCEECIFPTVPDPEAEQPEAEAPAPIRRRKK